MPKVCAFGMTRRRGVSAEDDIGMVALRDSQAPVCTIVGKTWDLHVAEVLRVDRAENLAMIRDSVGFLKAEGREVIYDAEHFFDGFAANPDYALETLKAAEEAGADLVVLCDTNGGSLPERIAEFVEAAREALIDPGGHSLPQRLRRGGCEFSGRGRSRGDPGARYDQRRRRTLRQRGSDQRHRQPRPQKEPRSSAQERAWAD